MTDSYLTLRRNVWDFTTDVAPLWMIFSDLAGGLLGGGNSTSPIQEHDEVFQAAREVSVSVWVALNLEEICPSMPAFPLLSQTPEAIRLWQLENEKWCEQVKPVRDPKWLAQRFEERYADVRQVISHIPLIDEDAFTTQLRLGHDSAVERWIGLVAARKALGALEKPGKRRNALVNQGRRAKNDDLLDFDENEREKNLNLTDKEVLAAFRKKHRNHPIFESDNPGGALRAARSRRKNKRPRT